ncbi:MAG: hypothetical protein LQ338_003762 [Usnochroma carphineum]|nr:MAG: hypothetical protein LQ338_003762 [Usnochroma carphineum]
MPYFPDSQQWLHQSTLLLSAYPTTTRITTKYRISPPPSPRKRTPATTTSPAPPTQQQPPQPPQPTSRAHLILKTYDPVSGACLKYKTDKAAEVGRLVAALGRCGRAMSGLAEEEEGVVGKGEEKREDAMDIDDEGEGGGKPALSEKEGAKKDGGRGGGAQGQGQGQGEEKVLYKR